jgi:murein DD-endopeptidase MepM/ murein hydrolase activator NlpD
VDKGEKVKKGQKIGEVGTTGNSTGCHLHWMVKSGVKDGENVYSNRTGKARNPWPRMAQNVTVIFNGPGINIRDAARGGVAVAQTQENGTIVSLIDGSDLGPFSQPRRWGGDVAGDEYEIGGIKGSTWTKVDFDGVWRYVASPLVTPSMT